MRRFHTSLTDFSKKVRTFASAFEKAAEKSLYKRIEQYPVSAMAEYKDTSINK